MDIFYILYYTIFRVVWVGDCSSAVMGFTLNVGIDDKDQPCGSGCMRGQWNGSWLSGWAMVVKKP